MKLTTEEKLIEEGFQTLYHEFGPAKTIKFFQLVGVSRGDTLKEIEEVTEKLSRDEALKLVRKENRLN